MSPQLPLDLGRDVREVAPGAVHVPGWLDLDQQRRLVQACREWATGPVPMRATRLPGGGQMSVRTVCLGWHWQPYRYTRTSGGVPVLPLPPWLVQLGRAAVATAYGDKRGYEPDAALVNYYPGGATMGQHQDRQERTDDPVVSLSLGDSCRFRLGNSEHRGRPWTDVELVSGDLLVFGGPSRLAFHGVPKVHAGTADPASGLPTGRLNITLRVTGLAPAG